MSAARFLHELREKAANARAHIETSTKAYDKDPRSIRVDLIAIIRSLSELVTMLDSELEQFTPVEIAKSSESSHKFRAVTADLVKAAEEAKGRKL
jgi:hypothetical protein